MSDTDIAGQKFGRLTVISRAGSDKHGKSLWLCRCDCGKQKVINWSSLRSGLSKSCGCLRGELASVAHHKHGHSVGGRQTPTYRSWRAMIYRCTNPNDKYWHRYGGANPPVTVSDRWLVFENFFADMGPRPDGTTLGRYGDTGNYEPGNCKWMTDEEQRAEQKKKRQAVTLAKAA